MPKLKQLKEKRASVYSQIDELRKAADGREMTSEEQARWDTLLAEYTKADKAVEAEERFVEIHRRQAETVAEQRAEGTDAEKEYRSAFLKRLQGKQLTEEEKRAMTTAQESVGTSIPSTKTLIPSAVKVLDS